MYDNFEPLKVLKMQDFTFQPTRYEIWMKGKMTTNGNTKTPIIAKVILENGKKKIEVSHSEHSIIHEISSKNIFDIFVTAIERLQLVTIPAKTNVENVAINMFRMTVGITREIKNFETNEPYCCNIFLQNKKIVKLTFSFSNPEKLLEFYNQ